jgi:KDO2-lipid IV(A) lauroyltransferase
MIKKTKQVIELTVMIQKYFEGVGFSLICTIFSHLSLERASRLGGWIGRKFGPLFPVSRTALGNLNTVFPRLTTKEKKAIMTSMWQEWGNVAAEYCHLPRFLHDTSLYTIEGLDVLERLKQDGKPALLFTGHLSNFQLVAVAGLIHNLPLVQFYRRAKNPFVDRGMLLFQQQVTRKVIAKGPTGMKELLKSLKEGEHILMMVDQKFHQGLMVPFLGHPAATASSIATLSKRFDCPLVPVRVERTHPLHFRITFYPPMDTTPDETSIITHVNETLGKWVKDRPEQWFWVHKRWPFST